jgi:membrane protease YdiL (CAAX protease family)
MNSHSEPRGIGPPGLVHLAIVLCAILVLYPLAGYVLTMIATGARPIVPDAGAPDPSLLSRIRFAQVAGQLLVLALPVFWLAKRFSGSPSAFGRGNLIWLGFVRPSGFRPLLAAACGMLLLQPLMYTVVELQNLALPMLGPAGLELLRQQAQLESFIRKLAGFGSFPEFLAVTGMLVATPALCEELFFRGYVQRAFMGRLRPGAAVFLSGFVFALFHMEPANIVPLTLLGGFIGYIYRKTGTLAVPGAAHAANNFAALMLLRAESHFPGVSISGQGATIVSMWQWWALVLVSLVLFFRLVGRFPGDAPPTQPDNNL